MDSLEVARFQKTTETYHDLKHAIFSYGMDYMDVEETERMEVENLEKTEFMSPGRTISASLSPEIRAVQYRDIPVLMPDKNFEISKSRIMALLFERYLRALHRYMQSFKPSRPDLGPEDSVSLAMRRIGAHVLKDAKKLYRVLVDEFGPLEAVLLPGYQGCLFNELTTLMLLPMTTKRAAIDKLCLEYEDFAQCMGIANIVSNVGFSDEPTSDMCLSLMRKTHLFKLEVNEDRKIGLFITEILSKE